jgi:MFS family permease
MRFHNFFNVRLKKLFKSSSLKNRSGSLQRSYPIIITSFVNKCGSVALMLLPILMIEKALSSEQASIVLGSIRIIFLTTTLIAGILTDRIGLRVSIFLSFCISVLGLVGLYFAHTFIAILVASIVAQMGQAIFVAPARMLVTNFRKDSDRKFALALMSTANNFGQILAFSVAMLFAHLGVNSLVLFDALTTCLAGFLALRILPEEPVLSIEQSLGLEKKHTNRQQDWFIFIGVAILLSGYAFFYEIFMVGLSAKLKLQYVQDGLRIFATLITINTSVCSLGILLTVRYFSSPFLCLTCGAGLISVACIIIGGDVLVLYTVFLAVLFFTMGQILFIVTGNYLLIQTLPYNESPGVTYSIGLFIQTFGKVLGASFAFPILIDGNNAQIFIGAVAFVWIFHSIILRPYLSLLKR